MPREIPVNNRLTFERSVRDSDGNLGTLVEKLHQNKHVLSVTTVRNGAFIDVTVEYAVMDLALLAAGIGTDIENEFPKG